MAKSPTKDASHRAVATPLPTLGARLVERSTPDGAPDPVARSSYVRRYEAELARRPLAASSQADVYRAASRAQIVLVAEFHPLPGAARSAGSILESLVRGGNAPRLGLELAQGRDQRALDAFLRGGIDAREVRERVAYDREWGYPWEPVEDLLESARRLGIPVIGLDVAPRGDARDLRIRDRVVARRLARLAEGEGRPLVVLFGEAHLAQAHLPEELRREFGPELLQEGSVLRIFHDLPASPRPARGSTWTLDRSTFVSYPDGAETRSAALERVWRRWARSRPDARLEEEALLHALARMQLDALGLDARRVALPGGGVLADLFPRLVPLEPVDLVLDQLAESGVESSMARALVGRAREEGALHVEAAGLAISAGRGVSALARCAGTFCARALAASANLKRRRASPEGDLLRETVAEALARLADPVTSPRQKERELAWARKAKIPADASEARTLGGALARAVIRGSLHTAQLRRAARRIDCGAKAGRGSMEALVKGLQSTDNC